MCIASKTPDPAAAQIVMMPVLGRDYALLFDDNFYFWRARVTLPMTSWIRCAVVPAFAALAIPTALKKGK